MNKCIGITGNNPSSHSQADGKYCDVEAGAYISENSTHYFLPDWAYLGQESCQNTVKEYSEHKIKAIFELSTLENPYIDSLFGLIYEF